MHKHIIYEPTNNQTGQTNPQLLMISLDD